MAIDNDLQTILLSSFQQSNKERQPQSYEFHQLIGVQKSDFKMESLEMIQADFEQEYKYSFQLNFTPETVILLSCSLQEDCT